MANKHTVSTNPTNIGWQIQSMPDINSTYSIAKQQTLATNATTIGHKQSVQSTPTVSNTRYSDHGLIAKTLVSLKKSQNINKSNDGNYKTQFLEMSAIGSGGFGTVFKVKHRLDDKIYAVKKVQFGAFSEEKKQRILNEVKSLAKLDSDFVVKYYNSWLESNHLFIQMDFIPQSLRSLLNDKPIVFDRLPDEEMNVFEYFISCEIFKEILECVQYLHECKPPVIHRDLKPDNILIDPNIRSNRIVKLCDFGLATNHDINSHTVSEYGHTFGVGTLKYMAPEVHLGKQYNHKADIYSIYVIGEELFSIDLQA
ncbi:unnamed protein product [Medioppia subpectinata]|uniref:Protein kinase domain-containing protein n=1 Tax=Medioppia subpectinata TaxID=1979941 RepID=A0A7R9KV20_9ACAR|nr:unnamed protein product [Medioppia subpectinata]CAG2109199.1 unnamed protein product [Medioppia subpectinata]